MAHNDIEIEIQCKVENVSGLVDFLKKEGSFQEESFQVDEYFSPAHRDFLASRPVNEWLRVRNADGVCSITYKNWYSDEEGRGCHCDEFETKMESIEAIKKIFNVLDFAPIVTVNKRRKTWTYNNYEVAIDSVEGLGNFVEVEYIGKDCSVNPKEVSESMIEFLKDVSCGKIERNNGGYPFLLLFPEEAVWEEK